MIPFDRLGGSHDSGSRYSGAGGSGARTKGGPPLLVVDDNRQHGVAAYARDLASEIGRLVGRGVATTVDEVAGGLDGREVAGGLDGREIAGSLDEGDEHAQGGPATDRDGTIAGGRALERPRAHLQFTDRLWGASPDEAATSVERLAARTRLTVTLHDLPQPSDGERNLRRRGDCYARVVAACAGVVVNSRHEALLLHEFTTGSAQAAVIPLPVDVHPAPASRPAGDGNVAVLGFFYPGKGHAEVVEAVAALPDGPGRRDVGVAVLGRASSGHEGELAELVADAHHRGVPVEVSGWLDDDDLLDRCRRASVPVAAHRHVSASASVTAWIAAGRRPLVPDSRASRELAELRPGTLTLVSDGGLSAAVDRALVDPDSTWLGADAVTRPDLADTARAYLQWWAEVAR